MMIKTCNYGNQNYLRCQLNFTALKYDTVITETPFQLYATFLKCLFYHKHYININYAPRVTKSRNTDNIWFNYIGSKGNKSEIYLEVK